MLEAEPLENIILEASDLSISYGIKKAIDNLNIQIPEKKVTAIIGPSGCGKSTLLRSFNRMNDFIDDLKIEGNIYFQRMDLYAKLVDPVTVRKRIGMVFQKPNPFPKSIYKNLIWGPKVNGMKKNYDLLVEEVLKKSALWDEVKDRLHDSALALSGGQQQRLCIARSLAMEPEILLMDEPCSALDPISTSKIEDLIFELKEKYTIVIVTHNMQQAARVSDYTAFLENGFLIEFGKTDQIFTRPKKQRTSDYIMGRFG